MTILSALVRLYDRMETEGKAPKPGFSTEQISFSLVIDREGRPLRLSDIRRLVGKKPAPVRMVVPSPPKERRGTKIVPGLLWDPSPYSLGVSIDENKYTSLIKDRAPEKFSAFKKKHMKLLANAKDEGLKAMYAFLESWRPEQFDELGFYREALKTNIIFEIEGCSGSKYIHERIDAIDMKKEDRATESICLVTGKMGPVERLHPPIKGVMGAKSSGASLVSYNEDAYVSFGKSQGENASVSQHAAFAYGAALNALLERKRAHGQEQHLCVGDTTVVFWAEAAEAETANFCEWLMGQALNPPDDDSETNQLRARLKDVAHGRAAAPKLYRDTNVTLPSSYHRHSPQSTPVQTRAAIPKVYILGLAPNAARLSVRFWYPGSFGDFADNILQFWEDLHIEPSKWKGSPAVWSLLYETAIRVGTKPKAETIPPLLGGEVMRSVLSGKPLPRMLLSAIIRRVRADGNITGRRAAICKAVINRTLAEKFPNHFYSEKEAIPVSLDPDNLNPAYRLGRLFAVLESAQLAALPKLKATIKDRYFAAASATPARVFPLLVKNATHHLARLKKGDKSKLGYWFEKEMGMIWLGLDVNMPLALTLEDQGRFIAGYYHQRWTKADKINKTNHEADEAQVTETIR